MHSCISDEYFGDFCMIGSVQRPNRIIMTKPLQKQRMSSFHNPVKIRTKKKIDPVFIRSRSSTAKHGIPKHKNALLVSGTGHIKTPVVHQNSIKCALPRQGKIRA